MQIDRQDFPEKKISAFYPMKDKEGITVPGWIAKDADLYQTLFSFKDGLFSQVVNAIRAENDKSIRDKLKQSNLPAFTFSCTFKNKAHRKTENIESKTNLLCIDIDEKGVAAHIRDEQLKGNENYSIETVRDRMMESSNIMFSSLSASGKGVCIIVKINEGEHEDAFNDIQLAFRELYNIEIDPSCRDYVRLRFATFDPNCWILPWDEVSPYPIRPEYWQHKEYMKVHREKLQNKTLVFSDNSDRAEYVLKMSCDMVYKAQEGERHNKIRSAARLLGGYVASGILDEDHAREALITTVEASTYDDIPDAIKAIDWGLSNGKLSPLDINIITPDDPNFKYFTEQDEARQREITNLYSKIRQSIRAGISITQLDYQGLAQEHLIDISRIKEIADQLYTKFGYEFSVDKKPVIGRVEAFLTGQYEFRRDVIQGSIEGRNKGERDYEVMKIENVWREVQATGLKFKFEDIQRLLKSDYVPEINPWEEHFKAISKDVIKDDPINDLANYVKCVDPNEQPYFNWMFKKMLVRTIKCALDDEYANRYVFVFASQTQSNGKSWFIRWLNPFGSHRYYAENPLEDNKDSRIRLSETFIYNLEELSSINKYEINRLKATISQIGTRDRLPYGRQAENIIRRCSFFGSTNNLTFLVDDVNTRWLCFEIESIDWSYAKKVDKNKIWAQAYQLYLNNFDCELTEREQLERDDKNIKFRVEAPEHELMRRYFLPADCDTKGGIFLTATTIQERIASLTKDSRINISSTALGKALVRCGFKRERYTGIWGYWVLPVNQTPAQTDESYRSRDNRDVLNHEEPPF